MRERNHAFFRESSPGLHRISGTLQLCSPVVKAAMSAQKSVIAEGFAHAIGCRM
jgi:hypothetical protein